FDLEPAHVVAGEVEVDLSVVRLADVDAGVIGTRRERVIHPAVERVRWEDPVFEVVDRARLRYPEAVDAEEEHAVVAESLDGKSLDQRSVHLQAVVRQASWIRTLANSDSLVLARTRL